MLRKSFKPLLRRPIAAGFSLVLALLPMTGMGQDPAIDPLLPKEVPEGEPAAPVEVPDPETGLPDSDAVLAPAITGITLREWDGGEVDVAAAVPEGARVESQTLSKRTRRKLQSYLSSRLDQPLTLAELNRINRDLILRLRERGYPVVDVAAPAGQEVSGGRVRLLLLLGRLQEISTTGQQHFSEAEILRGVRSREGEVISSRRLSRDLNWLNRNPFRTVNAVLQRGSEAGQTRVALRVRDRRPFRVYGGYENTGTELTGEDRALAGFNLGNLWGRGHRLGYQGTISTESSGFEAHSLDYVLPLPWRHELRVFAVDQRSDPPEDEEGFDLSADNTQYGARYEVPIVTRGSLSSGLRQSIVLGYDAKKSNNDLLFGGSRVLDNTTDISQGRLGYRFTRPDGFGYFDGYIDGVWSPGSDSEDAAFAEQRALATSDYTYARASLKRHTRFSARWNWQLNLVGQWADGNLLPSEQLGIGGHDTVRGYEEFAQLGDQGVIVNNELHFLTRLFGLLPQPLDLFAFYDYGLVSNVDLLPDERDNRDLSSVGVGLRFQFKSAFSFSLAYGHQLTAVEPGEDEDDRLHASLLLAF